MIKSKTKISKQAERKTSSNLVETILSSKKNNEWNEVASILSGPRKGRVNMNLGEINRLSKAGETIVIPGKVLSQGEIDKKIKLVALGFSENAREKILQSKSEIESLLEEIKKNPNAKGVKILNRK
ncbi:MAG: 50S ribosomal protein L18e [Nanoarchaeota archaeon]